jgi:PqqD family protein of HPr-rel-A system
MTAQKRYRAEPDEALIVRQLEDIDLIYHRLSGQTHMVMSPIPEILAALGHLPEATVETVRDSLARDFDLGAPEDALSVITEHLEEMVRLGLVRRL